MSDKKRRTISFTLDNDAYEEIVEYARIKGHGGQFPASVFAHYAVILGNTTGGKTYEDYACIPW
jgi:hypothetical protein